jgi:hypothetical protein
MGRLRKILLWGTGSLAVLVALVLGFLLAAPYLINLEPIKDKVLHLLSQQTGGKVEFKRVELSFFPRPRVKVHQVRLAIREGLAGTVESIQAYPELLAILRREVRVSGIVIESPHISIHLGKGRAKAEEKPKRPLLEEIREAIGQVSAAASANFPDLDVVVRNGGLEAYEESRLVSSFNRFDGRIFLSGRSVRMNGSCSSNICEKMSVEANLNPADLKGQMQLDLVNFHPHALTGALLSGSPWTIEDSRMDLQLRIKAESLNSLRAELNATSLLVAFRQGKRATEIRGKGLTGHAILNGDEIEISVDELILDRPRVTLSGKFQKGGQTSLHVEAKEVDVGSTREATLAIAGEVPVVQTIFDYVRAGRIPLITFDSQGRSMEDLGRTVNLSIKGRMEGGEVFVRPAQLHLEKVRGDVLISRGILQGKDLEAAIGKSRGREGILRVGLEGKKAPFHLEMTLDADPTQVQPLLGRVIQNEDFRKESSLIEILNGSAKGKLILGESLDSIHAQVDVSAFSVSANYRRIPFPIQITNGQFHYEKGTIGLKDVGGSVGRSSFAELTGQFTGGREVSLEVTSGRLAVVLDEIYPWLSSRESLREFRENVQSASGGIRLSEVNLKGPALRPRDWYFQAVGDMEDVVVETSVVPGPVAVTSGTFKMDPERLSISNFKTKILDTSVGVSGTFYDYSKGIERADLEFSGEVAQGTAEWLSDLLHFKGKTQVRTPLSISGARLSWHRGVPASFKGDITVKDGPQISLEILQKPHHLTHIPENF